MAEHLDLDALEKVARETLARCPSWYKIGHDDSATFTNAFAPETVLKLIALARLNPPAASGEGEP